VSGNQLSGSGYWETTNLVIHHTLPANGMSREKGQSFLELLIAMGVFILIVSSIVFLIIDSHIVHRIGREETIAAFLAEEGLEAASSIRNNSWEDLAEGEHGISFSGGSWIFLGVEEDIGDKLKEGTRKIIVKDVDLDRKKVSSKVTWQLTKNRPLEVESFTYLTNWQKIGPLCYGEATECFLFKNPRDCRDQDGCFWFAGSCQGTPTPCSNFQGEADCLAQQGCSWGFNN